MTGDPKRFSRFLSTAGDTEGGGLIYVNATSVSQTISFELHYNWSYPTMNELLATTSV